MKKTIKTLAIFSLIMSGIYFGKWFIQTDYFKIREIPVSGDNALLKRSIVSKLEKLKGENIVYIDTKKNRKDGKGRCESKKCYNSESISK